MKASAFMHWVREWIEAWGMGLVAAWEFGKRAEGRAGESRASQSHSSLSSFLNPAPLFALSHNVLSSSLFSFLVFRCCFLFWGFFIF